MPGAFIARANRATETITATSLGLDTGLTGAVTRRLTANAINTLTTGALPPTGTGLPVEFLGGTGVVPGVAAVARSTVSIACARGATRITQTRIGATFLSFDRATAAS